MTDDSEANVLYYICGYIAKTRSKYCEDCAQYLRESEFSEPQRPKFDFIDATVKQFINFIDRGGLSRPSLFTYCVSLKCWCVFSEMKKYDELFKMFLDFKYHRDLFQAIVVKSIEMDDSISDFVMSKMYCTKKHFLLKIIIDFFFNCVAKNIVKDMTNKFRNDSLMKKRKINKLTGND